MTQGSNENASPSYLQRTSAPPTQPGVYWFHSETARREMLVEVRLKDGKLIAWWPNQDTPVADMKGFWRGPIPPSTGPGSR
jgi:hypothetical protein